MEVGQLYRTEQHRGECCGQLLGGAPKEPAMSILTAFLVVVMLGATALVIFFSLVLAKCEDEARSMVQDTRQLHYGSEVE